MHKYNLIEHLAFLPVYLNKKRLRKKLKGKTVIITGASYGIGEKLTYQLAETEAHLILIARTKEKLTSVKKNLKEKPAQITVFAADLRNEKQITSLLNTFKKQHKTVDYIISNAGKSIRRSINDSLERYHDFTRTMAINYFAPVRLLLNLIPLLKKSRGHIINISAANVRLIPAPYWAAYQASKAAFDNWLNSAAPELKIMGITASSIYLPLVKTRMIEPTKKYKNMPAMSPEHVARIICKIMYTKKSRYSPWWLILGELASIILRPVLKFIFVYLLKRKKKRAK